MLPEMLSFLLFVDDEGPASFVSGGEEDNAGWVIVVACNGPVIQVTRSRTESRVLPSQ